MNEQIQLTVPEAAKILGVTDATVYSRIKMGELPAEKEGSRVRITLQALSDFNMRHYLDVESNLDVLAKQRSILNDQRRTIRKQTEEIEKLEEQIDMLQGEVQSRDELVSQQEASLQNSEYWFDEAHKARKAYSRLLRRNLWSRIINDEPGSV